jgi:hypothetical protein
MLGLGRTSLYHLVRTDRLRVVRIGSAIRFSVDHLREFVETQTNERSAAGPLAAEVLASEVRGVGKSSGA